MKADNAALADDEWKTAWLPELKARLAAHKRGDGQSNEWTEVVERIRKSLVARKS